MNLIGKIFVVFIFVMSIVYMSLAMMVYATHRNYREEIMLPQEKVTAGKELGYKYRLEKALADNNKLKDEKDKSQKELETERATKQQILTKLENELAALRAERKALEAGYADLEKDRRDAVAAMNATQKAAADYRKERDDLRTEKIQAQQDRDAHFKEVVRLTDELHQTEQEREQLKKRMEDLAKDLAKAREALRYFDINENSDYKAKEPPRLDGVVKAVRGGGLIEISLGSDMGLRKGHILHVYRTAGGQNTYVGRVEVLQLSPDTAVCKMDPKYQNSNVMEGDRVASKLE
jgi:hypothetical protein